MSLVDVVLGVVMLSVVAPLFYLEKVWLLTHRKISTVSVKIDKLPNTKTPMRKKRNFIRKMTFIFRRIQNNFQNHFSGEKMIKRCSLLKDDLTNECLKLCDGERMGKDPAGGPL